MHRLSALVFVLAACSGSSKPTDECADGKCDLPTDPAEVSCTKRRSDAFNDNRLSFTENFLRWSCADVQGVTADDRGQEYCEYFAIAQVPGAPAGTVLGRNLGPDSSYGALPASLELTADQITALEQDEAAVVGQCVFTSWNSDIDFGVPEQSILGVPVAAEDFRMRFDVNSADAAQLLVEDCMTLPQAGDPEDPRDPRHDTFMRGCLLNAELNETEYRKSDTTVCASMARLAECGCSVTGDTPLAELISPWERRGFPLGGWQSFQLGDEAGTRLPANCRYVDLGDGSQTLVTCDLSASDLLYGAADLKQYCADKYADNIVVHVPVDPSVITCDPSTSESPYAATCSTMPWVVTPTSPAGN